eukprot:scaffold630095_cov20-Prasinocladus_malaysianus.AAC.1
MNSCKYEYCRSGPCAIRTIRTKRSAIIIRRGCCEAYATGNGLVLEPPAVRGHSSRRCCLPSPVAPHHDVICLHSLRLIASPRARDIHPHRTGNDRVQRGINCALLVL